MAACIKDTNFKYPPTGGLEVDGHINLTLNQAQLYTKNKTGWRIPNIKELKSIHEGTIDTLAFPRIRSSGSYHSSTIHVQNFESRELGGISGTKYESGQQHWLVNLDTGWVLSYNGAGSLRLIR